LRDGIVAGRGTVEAQALVIGAMKIDIERILVRF
jgi:hypothetical protein